MKSTANSADFVAKYGILVALAFLFSYIEAMIPVSLSVPGMKLGLANLVTIVGLYLVGTAGTIVISISRIVLTGVTFGNLFSMIYGLAGCFLSLVLMMIAKRVKSLGIIGVSVLGGVGHNLGQLCFAAYVVKTAEVFYYFPILLAAGVVAGAVIGIVGGVIVERIKKFVK